MALGSKELRHAATWAMFKVLFSTGNQVFQTRLFKLVIIVLISELILAYVVGT